MWSILYFSWPLNQALNAKAVNDASRSFTPFAFLFACVYMSTECNYHWYTLGQYHTTRRGVECIEFKKGNQLTHISDDNCVTHSFGSFVIIFTVLFMSTTYHHFIYRLLIDLFPHSFALINEPIEPLIAHLAGAPVNQSAW